MKSVSIGALYDGVRATHESSRWKVIRVFEDGMVELAEVGRRLGEAPDAYKTTHRFSSPGKFEGWDLVKMERPYNTKKVHADTLTRVSDYEPAGSAGQSTIFGAM